MLVPVTEPKFSFQRQRYLGNVLQNSVRFEADGWFAGWWVHNFDQIVVGDLRLDPDNLGQIVAIDKIVPGSMDKKYWVIKFPDAVVSFSFIEDTFQQWLEGTGNIIRDNDQQVTITGTTTVGDTFTAVVNAYTGAVISFVSNNPVLQASGFFADGLFHFKVTKPFIIDADYVYIRFGDDCDFETMTFTYNYDGSKHTWSCTGGTFTLDALNNLTLSAPGYVLKSYAFAAQNLENEQINCVIETTGTFNVNTDAKTDTVGSKFKFTSAGYLDAHDTTHLVDRAAMPATGLDLVNIQAFFNYTNFQTQLLDTYNEAIIGWSLPIWIKFQQYFTFEFIMTVGQVHPAEQTGTDPDTGDPIYSDPYFDCALTLLIKKSNKDSRVQNFLNISPETQWYINILGQSITEDMIGVDGYQITIAPKWTDSTTIETRYALAIGCRNISVLPNHPLPNGFIYFEKSSILEMQAPTTDNLPPPPPPWLFGGSAGNYHPATADQAGARIWPRTPPTGWANPVSWMIPWGASPVDWANPVAYPIAWPAAPSDWSNKVAYSLLYTDWPTTAPNNWPATLAWPPQNKPDADHPYCNAVYGVDTVPTEWPTIGDDGTAFMSFATYMTAQTRPLMWPAQKAFPLTPDSAWEPWILGGTGTPTDPYTSAPNPYEPSNYADAPWPILYPFGIDPTRYVDVWSSTAVTLAQYLQNNKPTNWPAIIPWPIIPDASWLPVIGGVINPTMPAEWAAPWPPVWPTGVDMGTQNPNVADGTWLSNSITYLDYQLNVIWPTVSANWPIAWSKVGTFPVDATGIGWLPVIAGSVNPNPPDVGTFAAGYWTPKWPLNTVTDWPFGISNIPPAWYGTESYIDYVQAHTPYMPPVYAADGVTMLDPGWVWPGYYPPNWESLPWADYCPTAPSTPWPVVPEAGWSPGVYNPITGTFVANTTAPANWPKELIIPIKSRTAADDVLSLYIGPDSAALDAMSRPYYMVLNRASLFANDPKTLFSDLAFEKVHREYITMPICCNAYIFYRVFNNDLTMCRNGVTPQGLFGFNLIGNAQLGINAWRLDTDALNVPAVLSYALSTIIPDLTGIQQDQTQAGSVPVLPLHYDISKLKIAISYINILGIAFDKTADWVSFNLDGSAVSGTVQAHTPQALLLSGGFYPEWCVPKDGIGYANRAGIDFFGQYSSFGVQGGWGWQLTFDLQWFEWFSFLQAAVSVTPENPTNNALLGSIYINGVRLNEPSQGQYTQLYRIYIDAAQTQYIDFSWDVQTPRASNVQPIFTSNITDFTLVSIVLTRVFDDMIGTTKHTINIVLEKVSTLYVSLLRSFIIDRAGILSAITMLEASASFVKLSNGQVSRSGLYTDYTDFELLDISLTPNTVKLFVTQANKADVQYLPKGIFQLIDDTVEYISVEYVNNELVLTFIYNGITYHLYIGRNLQSMLEYSVTDVRDNWPTPRSVYTRPIGDIMMAVKQFWSNNVTVEHFWWIDAEYVLELSKYNLTLYRKQKDSTGSYLLHDWDGDRWEIDKQAKRGNFFNTGDTYYGVSSALNTTPIVYKLQNKGTYIALLFITDIQAANFLNPVWQQINVPVVKLAYPSALRTNAISAFVELDINGLLLSGKISATHIGNDFIIGLVLSRGMLQWAIRLRLDNPGTFEIINGYGNVGHTGCLTGGQYPANYCNNLGFIGTVHDVAHFKDAKAYTPGDPYTRGAGADGLIYGSGTSLWFVFAQLNGIVSHYTFENRAFVMQTIPLQNNYGFAYELALAQGMHGFDSIPQNISLFSLIGQNGTLATVAGYMTPSYQYLSVIMGSAIYNAAALHQSAYVIRNHLPIKSDDGKSDRDISAQRFTGGATYALHTGTFAGLMAFALTIVSLAGDALMDELKADASRGSGTSDDTSGRKLGQFAANAVLDAISTSITMSGYTYSTKTSVTEHLSLSMFYSIDDGNQCWAGPGYVNHQFIGQAVVQGIAQIRFKMQRYGIFMPLEFLSQLTIAAQLMANKVALEVLLDLAKASGNYTIGIYALGSGTDLPLGQILSSGMQGGTAMIRTMVTWLEFCRDTVIPAIYNMLGRTVRGFSHGGANRNSIDTEATHSYGNKPMSMFWPVFGADAEHRNTITIERIDNAVRWAPIHLKLSGKLNTIPGGTYAASAITSDATLLPMLQGFFGGSGMPFDGYIAAPKDVSVPSVVNNAAALPIGMGCVEGIVKMLPEGDLKNLQVNCCDYIFPAPPIHDYVISQKYKIGVQAANGFELAYSMDDVKLIDGPTDNIIELPNFFGIACPYTAIEVKDTFDYNYLRPWAVTPTCIALNINKINSVQEAKAYHSFDGQFNRILSWKGGNGLNSAFGVHQYAFIINNHFKRSNIIPPSDFFGLFDGPPVLNMTTCDNEQVANQVMDTVREKGLDINIPGEDRDLKRYSIPIHTETLSTLPAVIRTIAPYRLHTPDGITSLCTDSRNTQGKYKAPSSVDFNIYDDAWRATEEYICKITTKDGMLGLETKVPSAGLTFIGATTKEAFFYSAATRMYYTYSGGGDLNKKEIFNRFTDIRTGRWDFVNQEVMFKALLTDGILVDDVQGYVNLRLDGNVLGEVYPANETIYNQRSDYKILSMAGGMVYQGPKRCAVNRFIILESMYDQIKSNKRKWLKLDREEWPKRREYGWHYDDWHTEASLGAVYGWTHNPWRAATAMLGIDEETDCKFEWELTFAWTEQVDKLFEQNEFISFNVAGETIGQGGTLLARPTHIFLYKELFKNGYYTMRYQSNNGIGNRERLYMWGDGLCALEDLALFTKDITKRRTQPLATSQVDVQELQEQ